MPTYTMRNRKTDETVDMVLSLSEREKFLEENPDWEQCLSAPKTVTTTISTLRRAGDGFKDVLREIKKKSGRDNTINL